MPKGRFDHRCSIVSSKLHAYTHVLVQIHHIIQSGIGLESAILFALEGANVLLVDINEDAVTAAAAKIAQKTPEVKIRATHADVGKEEDIKAAVDKAVAEFGRLDIMVRIVDLCIFFFFLCVRVFRRILLHVQPD